jgi:DNA-binding ferritin-like protein (Dps family)
MENTEKQNYISNKKSNREKKRSSKRNVTGEEVIFIFEKILEGWKTIRIFNTIVQNNPESGAKKKDVESISTGNCKVFEQELLEDRYKYYLELRQKVYERLK